MPSLLTGLGRMRRAAPDTPPSRTAGELIYAIGDVHGCYELLRDLLAKIGEDIALHPMGRKPVLIFCGDYVDRGPDSAKVLEALVWLQGRRDLELHLLKGNHEQAMCEFLENPVAGARWLDFGGQETLASYGVEPVAGEADEETLLARRDALLAAMPASHLRLLHGFSLMVVIGDYAFVHAGVRPGAALSRQVEEDLLWIRQGFLDWPSAFEKVIVHGHTWREDTPQMLEHRFGIDTGAYATGVLTAIRLEDEEVDILQARACSTSAE